MDDLAPPVPERFDDMHWIVWVFLVLLSVVLLVFWASVVLAVFF